MSSILFLMLLFTFLAAVAWATDTKEGAGKQPKELMRASNVTMKRIKVRLDQIVMDPDRFCHRDQAALTEESLKSLMDSLIAEGMQVPIEGYFDKQGRFVPTKGHRRVRSHQILAEKNKANFTRDMELDAIELADFTPEDLLVRSIADNEVRMNLDRVGRIRAAKKLHDHGVDESRAAAALGVSVKTYQRDLLIAKHVWMFQHVIDGSIEPSAAVVLLETAENADRLAEVKEDFDAWVAEKKRQLREKEKVRKLGGGKELSPAEKLIKRQLPKHLLEHWLELIKKGQRFDEDAEWDFAAHLDQEKGQLHIGSLNLDVNKTAPDQVAKVASVLSQLSKLLAPIVQKRLAEQQPGQAAEVAPWDMEYLKQVGAHELADHLHERLEKAKAEKVDGEDAPQEVPAERTESDLVAEVTLPSDSKEVLVEQPAQTASPPETIKEKVVEKKDSSSDKRKGAR